MTRVLVVENEELVRRVIVGALSRHGFDVVVCTTFDEALEALDGVDIVVTDLNLGDGAGGRELAASAGGRVPVIVVSGAADVLGGVPGAAAIVAKPFRHAELLAAIRSSI